MAVKTIDKLQFLSFICAINRQFVWQCALNIEQRLLPSDYIRRPGVCTERYGRFCTRLCRAVHRC